MQELQTMYKRKYNKETLTESDIDKITSVFNQEMEKLHDIQTVVHRPLYGDSATVNLIQFIDSILPDHFISYNGTIFKKEMSPVTDVISNFLAQRAIIKKQMFEYKANGDTLNAMIYNVKQNTKKLYANTIYGALGLKTFFLYNIDTVSTVTGNAREQLKTIILQLEKLFGNRVRMNSVDQLIEYITSNTLNNIHIDDININDITSSDYKMMELDELYQKFTSYLTVPITKVDENRIRLVISNIIKNDFMRLRLSYINELEKFLTDFGLEDVIKSDLDNLTNIEDYDAKKFISVMENSDLKYIEQLVYDNHIQDDMVEMVDKPRASVLTTDTDSVFISVERLTEFISEVVSKNKDIDNKQDMEIIAFRILSYFTGNSTSSFLRQMNSYHHNHHGSKTFQYKSEFYYRKLFILKVMKTYFGLLTVQEGYKVPITIDSKNLSKVSFPEISRALLADMSDYILKAEDFSLVSLYSIYDKFKDIVRKKLELNEYKLGNPANFKSAGNYKTPYSQNTYLAGNIFNILFPMNSYMSPEREYIFNLIRPEIEGYRAMNADEKIKSLKENYKNVMSNESYIFFCNMLDCNDAVKHLDLVSMKEWVIKEGGIKYIGLKDSIPDWIKPIIDVDTLISKNIDAYASRILEALKIHVDSTSDKLKKITPIVSI